MLLLLSVVSYYRVKRWEMSIRASTRASTTAAAPATPATATSTSDRNIYLFSADDIVDENALRRGGNGSGVTTPMTGSDFAVPTAEELASVREAVRMERELSQLLRAGFL